MGAPVAEVVEGMACVVAASGDGGKCVEGALQVV